MNQNTQSPTKENPALLALNPDALQQLAMRMVGDLGAVVSGALVILGDHLGLYRVLAENGPAPVAELAAKANVNERYLQEWLACQAASGYISHESGRFFLTAEQAAVFANADSPVAMVGGFYAASSTHIDEAKVADAFRTGKGIPWGDHHDCLFCGTERFFRPGYAANLTQSWIPSLEGVEEKLQTGIRVADIGCGRGASTIIMARAFPRSTFIGFDVHPPSIEQANAEARKHGLTNLSFEVATAKTFPGNDYDFVTIFDALHDMGDPVGASVHVRESLKTPASRSQEVGLALGAQAGEKRLRGVVTEAGFSRFRRATETPFNLILEARP